MMWCSCLSLRRRQTTTCFGGRAVISAQLAGCALGNGGAREPCHAGPGSRRQCRASTFVFVLLILGWRPLRVHSKDVHFLVAQWLRLLLPMQGAGVRSLVRELEPTYHN